MKCPKCDVLLSIADRQGIEIDYCPQCRGIWLDRGELDKIIERTNTAFSQKKKDDDDDDDYRHRQHDHDRDFGKYGHGNDYDRRHKKKSMFGDLFDFD